MSNSTTTMLNLPSTAFNRTQGGLHRFPPELAAMVHELVVASDTIVVSSRNARKGLLGPVYQGTGELESTFSFSSRYSGGLSNKPTFDEYRAAAQRYIINDMKYIIINVEDMQFANALQFLRTLKSHGKLQAFLRLPDARGRPNYVSSPRVIEFHHHITKNFPADSSRIKKFHKQVQHLKQSEADLNTEHSFKSFKDSIAIRQCMHDLGRAGTFRSTLQIDLIAMSLRTCIRELDAEQAKIDQVARDSMACAEQIGAIRRALARQLAYNNVDENLAGDDVQIRDEIDMGDYEAPVAGGSWGYLNVR